MYTSPCKPLPCESTLAATGEPKVVVTQPAHEQTKRLLPPCIVHNVTLLSISVWEPRNRTPPNGF